MFHIPTVRDFKLLEADEVLKYDSRTFKEYFLESLKQKHLLIFAYWRMSLADPQFIRLTNFYLRMSFVFALNALFYTDSAVEQKNIYVRDNPDSVCDYLIIECIYVYSNLLDI